MNRVVLIYGLVFGGILILLKTLEYKWMAREISLSIYIFLIAIFFLGLGIWLSYKLLSRNNNSAFEQNKQAIKQLDLSQRELEVLEKMVTGLSNQEIADSLFVSINTIKTHLKNGFAKLGVNNRIQAINKLKSLSIFP